MDKLRIGILGLGRGITHLKNFLTLPEAEVIGAAVFRNLARKIQARAQEVVQGMHELMSADPAKRSWRGFLLSFPQPVQNGLLLFLPQCG